MEASATETVVILDKPTFIPEGRPGVFSVAISGWAAHRQKSITQVIPQAAEFGIPTVKRVLREDLEKAIPEFKRGVWGFQIRIPALDIDLLENINLSLSVLYEDYSKEIISLDVDLNHTKDLNVPQRSADVVDSSPDLVPFKEFIASEGKIFFPQVYDPLVSIIVTTWQLSESIYRSLRSLERIWHRSAEVLIASAGKSNGDLLVRDYVEGATMIVSENPDDKVRTLNRCALQARGQYLLFLGTGIEMTTSAAEELLEPFRSDPNIGAVSGNIINSHGVNVGGIYKLNLEGVMAPVDPARVPAVLRMEDGLVLGGDCLVVSRAVFAAMGGFSIEFSPDCFHDADLSLRLLEAGYSLGFAGKALCRSQSEERPISRSAIHQKSLAMLHQSTLERQVSDGVARLDPKVSVEIRSSEEPS